MSISAKAPVPNDPAIFKVLDDGTVLYKTWEQAETARKEMAKQKNSETVKKQSQARLGDQYLAKDGTVAPYSIGALIEFQFTGLIVVIVVLAGLSIICAAIGRLIRSIEKPEVASINTPSAAPVVLATEKSGIHPGLTDTELVVILTAAASEMIGSPVRLERLHPHEPRNLNWAAQGRVELLQSHRLK